MSTAANLGALAQGQTIAGGAVPVSPTPPASLRVASLTEKGAKRPVDAWWGTEDASKYYEKQRDLNEQNRFDPRGIPLSPENELVPVDDGERRYNVITQRRKKRKTIIDVA